MNGVLRVTIVVCYVCIHPHIAIAQLDTDILSDQIKQTTVLLSFDIDKMRHEIHGATKGITQDLPPALTAGLSTTAQRTVISAGAEARSVITYLIPYETNPNSLPKATVSSVSPNSIDLVEFGKQIQRTHLPSTVLVGGYGFGGKTLQLKVYGNERPSGGDDVSRFLFSTSPMLLQLNVSEGNGLVFKAKDERLELLSNSNVIATVPITWVIRPEPVHDTRELYLNVTTEKDDKDKEIYFDYQIRRDDTLIACAQQIGAEEKWETGHKYREKLNIKGEILPGMYRIDVYAFGPGEWDGHFTLTKEPPGGMPLEQIEPSPEFRRHFDPNANNEVRKHLAGCWVW